MQEITYRMRGVSVGKLDHSSVKRYTIPRKARRVSEDCQSQISLYSREAKEIENSIKRLLWNGSELDNIFNIDQIYKVDNPALERKFQKKRSELREDGRSQKELTEHLAFLIETTHQKVKDICVNGMKCNGNDSLGDGQMGVSLWKSPDLLLKNLECPETGVVYLVVFKIVKGRVKQVVTKPRPQAPNLEPTPNYDCHMSRTAPSPSMNDLQTLLKSTQYYLYEYDDEGLPCEKPRLCLPSAVIHLRRKNQKKKVIDEHAQSRESNSVPWPQFTENNEVPFLTESCGSVAWRGLITNKEKGLGWVTVMSGHKLGLNLWKSYLDVTKKISLVEMEKIIPGDIRSAWTTPLPYRGCVLSLCLLKATVPYTESFIRFTKTMSEKAKAVGVICVDSTTTMFLLPSSSLTVRLGIFRNVEPWRMCCIVCRHKSTAGITGSMTACRPATLLLPTAIAKATKKVQVPTAQFIGHTLDTTVQHRDHIQLPQITGSVTQKSKSVVSRSHSDSDCWYSISNRSSEYHSSHSKAEQTFPGGDVTEHQMPHLDAKPQDKNDDIDVPENNHSSNSEVFTNLNSITDVNTVTQLKKKKKRSCSADLSPRSVKKYIRHAKNLRKCYSKKSSSTTAREECPSEKCDTLPVHPARNQQIRSSSHNNDTTDFDLKSDFKENIEVIYVDSSSEIEDKTESSGADCLSHLSEDAIRSNCAASNSNLRQRADACLRNEYKLSEITCKGDVSESNTLTTTADNGLVLSDNYCENSESTVNQQLTIAAASQGTTPSVTSPITVLKDPSELPPHGYEKLKMEGILPGSEPKTSHTRSPKRQSLWDSVSDLGSSKNAAASEKEEEEDTSTVSTLTESESSNPRMQPLDSSLLQKGNLENYLEARDCSLSPGERETCKPKLSYLNVLNMDNNVQLFKLNDYIDTAVAATPLQGTEDQDTVASSSCYKMTIVVEVRDCLEQNEDTLTSLENESSSCLSKSHDTTNSKYNIPDTIENGSITVETTKFPLSPVFKRKPRYFSAKEISKGVLNHGYINTKCNTNQVPPRSGGIGDGMSLISTFDTVKTVQHDAVSTTVVNKESDLSHCHHNSAFRSSDLNIPRKSNTNHSTPITSNSPNAKTNKGIACDADAPNAFDCSKSNHGINDAGSCLVKSNTTAVGSLSSKLHKPDTSRQSYARAFRRVFVSLKSSRKRRHSDTELTSNTAECSTREVKRRFSLDKPRGEKEGCKMTKGDLNSNFPDFTSGNSTMKECKVSSPVSSPIISSSDLTPKSLEKYERHKKLKPTNFDVKCSQTSSRRQSLLHRDTKDEEGTAAEAFPLSKEPEIVELDTKTDTTELCSEDDTALSASAALRDIPDISEIPDSKTRHGCEYPPSTKSTVTTSSVSQPETRGDYMEDDAPDTQLEKCFRFNKANIVGERQKAGKELRCDLLEKDSEASLALFTDSLIPEHFSTKESETSPCLASGSKCKKNPFVSDSADTAIQDKTVEIMPKNIHGEGKIVAKTNAILSHPEENERENISRTASLVCRTDTKCLESVLDIPYLKTSTAQENVSSVTKKVDCTASVETVQIECVVSRASISYPFVSDDIKATEDLNSQEDISGKAAAAQGENSNTCTTNNLEWKTNVKVPGRTKTLPKYSIAQCNNSIAENSESEEIEPKLNQNVGGPYQTAFVQGDKLVKASCPSNTLDTGIPDQKNSTVQQPPVCQLKSIVSASISTGNNTTATDSKPSNIEHITTLTTTNHTCRENTSQSKPVLVSLTSNQSCRLQVQGCDIQDHGATKRPDILTEKAEVKEHPNQGQKENENGLNLNEKPLVETNKNKRNSEAPHQESVSVPRNTKRQERDDCQFNAPKPHGLVSDGPPKGCTRGPLLPSHSPANPLPQRWSPPVNYPCSYPYNAEPRSGYTSDRFMYVPTLRPAVSTSFGWDRYRAPPVGNANRGYCFNNFERQVRPNVTSVSWSVPRLPFPVQTFSYRNNLSSKFSQRRC